MNTKTYLPMFQGFYGTFFEIDYECFFQDLDEQASDSNIKITQEMRDTFCESELDTEIYKEYQASIVNASCSMVSNVLTENHIIENLKFEKLVSPRFYNYSNDSINIEVEFSEKNIANIERIIKENFKDWELWLEQHFTSYDGFHSFYSNDVNKWDIRECLEHETKSGNILEFIIQCLNYTQDEFIQDVQEQAEYPILHLDEFLESIKK